MRPPTNIRTLGISLIILSSLGLLFSVAGIIGTWIIKLPIQNELIGLIDTLDHTLTTTDDGLVIMDGVIDDSVNNLSIISSTLGNLDTTIESIGDSLATSGALIGDDLRLTVIDTQSTLSSTATSAKLIDDFLAILASISILGVNYQAEVPLHIRLNQVAESLNNVPNDLANIEQSLNDTADGLNLLNQDISELSESIVNYEGDLHSARMVLNEYSNIIDKAQERTNHLRNSLSLYLTLFSFFITGILFWLGVSQVNVLLQGLNYLQGKQQVINLMDIRQDN